MIRRVANALLFSLATLVVGAMLIDGLYLPIFKREYFSADFDSRAWKDEEQRARTLLQPPSCPRVHMTADLIERLRWGRLPRERQDLHSVLGPPHSSSTGPLCDTYALGICKDDTDIRWLKVCFGARDRASHVLSYRLEF